jgi:hypothetical protein
LGERDFIASDGQAHLAGRLKRCFDGADDLGLGEGHGDAGGAESRRMARSCEAMIVAASEQAIAHGYGNSRCAAA